MRKSILSLTVAAFCSAPSFADTINVNDPENDYKKEDVSLGTGDSTINAKDVVVNGTFKVFEPENGSLTIKANNFETGGFDSTLRDNNAQYKQDIKIANDFTISGSSGLNLSNYITSNNIRQDINIDAKNFIINSNNTGISIATTSDETISNNLAINVHIKADSVNIDANGNQSQAIYLSGSNKKYREDNGVYLKMDSKNITLKGGGSYGAAYIDNIAVFATNNSILDICGSEGGILNIDTKNINSSNPDTFGNMSIFANDGSQVKIDYQKNSNLSFNGGFSVNGTRDWVKALISVNAQEGSKTFITGLFLAMVGEIDVKTHGNTYIDAPLIMSQSGIINIDIGDEYSTSTYNGIKGNLLAAYGDDIYGESVINVKLSGKNNVFTGTSSIYWNDAKDKNKINLDLRDGARWDVEKLENGNSGSLNNYLTSLNLNGGGL